MKIETIKVVAKLTSTMSRITHFVVFGLAVAFVAGLWSTGVTPLVVLATIFLLLWVAFFVFFQYVESVCKRTEDKRLDEERQKTVAKFREDILAAIETAKQKAAAARDEVSEEASATAAPKLN